MNELADPGREAAWERLLTRFGRRLRGYLRCAHCDPDEAEELLWDVWQVAVDHERILLESSDAWPLIHRLAKQACSARMMIKRAERRDRRSQAESIAIAPVEPPELDADLFLERVEAALQRLSKSQRTALDYHYRRGMPFSAVAKLLGVAEPTARVHAMRGLQKLRRLLTSHD